LCLRRGGDVRWVYLVGNLCERNRLRDLRMYGRILLKWTLKLCVPYTAVSFLTYNCKLLKMDSVTSVYLLTLIDNKWKKKNTEGSS
jgi:hypothetical protein